MVYLYGVSYVLCMYRGFRMYDVFIGVSYVMCMYRGFRMYGVFIGGFVCIVYV